MTSLNAPPMSICSQLALLTLIQNYVISKSWSSLESKSKIRRLWSPWLCPSFNYSLWGLAHFWSQPQVANQSTALWVFGVFWCLSFSPGCFPLFKLCHQQNFIQLSWRQLSCHHMNKVCPLCQSKTTGWTDHDKSCYVDLVLLVKPWNILLFIGTRAAWAPALHLWHSCMCLWDTYHTELSYCTQIIFLESTYICWPLTPKH